MKFDLVVTCVAQSQEKLHISNFLPGIFGFQVGFFTNFSLYKVTQKATCARGAVNG